MNKIAALIVIVVVVLGGWLLFRGGSVDVSTDMTRIDEGAFTQVTPTPVPTTPVSTSTSTDATTGTVKEFTVEGGNFFFKPNTLTVNKGDTVKITFKNSGGVHDFVLDEFSVHTKQISGGAEEVVTFVADKAGTFEYYCSVGTHRQMGMKGTLTVK